MQYTIFNTVCKLALQPWQFIEVGIQGTFAKPELCFCGKSVTLFYYCHELTATYCLFSVIGSVGGEKTWHKLSQYIQVWNILCEFCHGVVCWFGLPRVIL